MLTKIARGFEAEVLFGWIPLLSPTSDSNGNSSNTNNNSNNVHQSQHVRAAVKLYQKFSNLKPLISNLSELTKANCTTLIFISKNNSPDEKKIIANEKSPPNSILHEKVHRRP